MLPTSRSLIFRFSFITSLCLFLFCSDAFATIRYVSLSGAGLENGSSWTNASASLSDMLAICLPGDSIWVSAGTYFPDRDTSGNMTPPNNRKKTFFLSSGIRLFGGFAGSETLLSQRDIALNPTIFNGDMGIYGDSSDNVYNVFWIDNTTMTCIIDGCTITRGNANLGTTPGLNGGGGINVGSQISGLILRSCTFIKNRGIAAGAVQIRTGIPLFLIEGCMFQDNAAAAGSGAMIISGVAPPMMLHISNTTFSNNSGGTSGAISVSATLGSFYEFHLEHSNFYGNRSATGEGGALTIAGSYQHAEINNCIFENNQAALNGGAISITTPRDSVLTMKTNVFVRNKATQWGGALFVKGQANGTMDVNIINNTFYDNYAAVGETSYIKTSPLSIILRIQIMYKNCIIYHRPAFGNAGDAVWENEGTHHFFNCLVQGIISPTISTYHSQVFSNIYPEFTDTSDLRGPDNLWRTADDGLHLKYTSPGFNLGGNSYLGTITSDFKSAARISNDTTDIGAYENAFICPSQTTVYVDSAVVTPGDGSSWANAYRSLSEALKFASVCNGADTIKVARGTYFPEYNFDMSYTHTTPRNASFGVLSGKVLLGGFDPVTGIRDPELFPSILSGDLGVPQNRSDNVLHVVIFSHNRQPSTLDGFTIQHGDGLDYDETIVEPYPAQHHHGSGILVINGRSNVHVRNCLIRQNGSYEFWLNENHNIGGGGIAILGENDNASPVIENCRFIQNQSHFGGGIALLPRQNGSLHPKLRNLEFFENHAYSGGSLYGGRYGIFPIMNDSIIFDAENCVFDSDSTYTSGALISAYAPETQLYYSGSFKNCIFTDGATSIGDEAIYVRGQRNFSFTNCLFSHNQGIIYIERVQDSVTFNNCTFMKGEELKTTSGDTLTLKNCIVRANSLDHLSSFFVLKDCVAKDFTGGGNVVQIQGFFSNDDPLFRDTTYSGLKGPDGIWRTHDDGAYPLLSSPGIDSCNNAFATTTDITGSPRILNGRVDPGAYEGTTCDFNISAPVPDTSTTQLLMLNCNESAPVPLAIDDCDGIINGTTSDPTSFASPGSYEIVWNFVDAAGNAESIIQMIYSFCGTGVEPVPASIVYLFPNPVKNTATLHVSDATNSNSYLLTIFNSAGQSENAQSIGNQNTLLDLSTLAPGIYYGKLTPLSGTSPSVIKIIVTK